MKETIAPGVNVSIIRVCSHGLDPSQLFPCRRKATTSVMVAPLSGRPVKLVRFDAVAGRWRKFRSAISVVCVGGGMEPKRPAAVTWSVQQA